MGKFGLTDSLIEEVTNIMEKNEPLHELSAGTLASYIKKAQRDVKDYAIEKYKKQNSSPVYTHSSDPAILYDKRKLVNRMKGIDKAANRLAKEDSAYNYESTESFTIGDQFEIENELFEITNINDDTVELVNNDNELFELSKKTLKSYIRKANNSANRAWAKADKEEDKSMSTDGIKYPEKQARHMNNANKALDIWRKRNTGLQRAEKRLTK